ncbi:MAG: 16S rRNA processing protein RimM [Candidatus Sericytochromatia bacterium]|nr:16S rRNA processing protein RimM [Candidatus Sericytochromatia bacterium]
MDKNNSSTKSAKTYISIGKVIASHGIHGFAKIYLLTDFPERFEELGKVYFFKEDKLMFDCKIQKARFTANDLLVKFDKFSTPEEINLYKNYFIKIPKEELTKLPEDVYYLDDLRGMKAYSENDVFLGDVIQVYNNANDILEIKTPEKKEVMVPLVKEIVTNVDMKNRKITIKLIPGLFDEDFESDLV